MIFPPEPDAAGWARRVVPCKRLLRQQNVISIGPVERVRTYDGWGCDSVSQNPVQPGEGLCNTPPALSSRPCRSGTRSLTPSRKSASTTWSWTPRASTQSAPSRSSERWVVVSHLACTVACEMVISCLVLSKLQGCRVGFESPVIFPSTLLSNPLHPEIPAPPSC